MARKKKAKEIYIRAGLADNLIRIAWKCERPIEDLRALNPDIKGNGIRLKLGQKVRLS